MNAVQEKYVLSERHACRIVSQHRGRQRYVPIVPADEDALARAIIALASVLVGFCHRGLRTQPQVPERWPLACRCVAPGRWIDPG